MYAWWSLSLVCFRAAVERLGGVTPLIGAADTHTHTPAAHWQSEHAEKPRPSQCLPDITRYTSSTYISSENTFMIIYLCFFFFRSLHSEIGYLPICSTSSATSLQHLCPPTHTRDAFSLSLPPEPSIHSELFLIETNPSWNLFELICSLHLLY